MKQLNCVYQHHQLSLPYKDMEDIAQLDGMNTKENAFSITLPSFFGDVD